MISFKTRGWALLNNGLELATGLGSIILLTRIFSPGEMGVWFMFIAVFALVSGLRDALTQPALVKRVAGNEGPGCHPGVKANFLAMAAFEMISNLVVLAVALFVQGPLQPLLLIYGCYSVPNAWFRWQTFFLRAHLNIRTIALSNVLVALIQWAGFLWIWHGQYSLTMLIIALGAASVAGIVIGAPAIPYVMIFRANITRSEVYHTLRFGGYAMLREATSAVSSRITLFYASALISTQHAAWLGVSQRFAQLFLLPNQAIQSILFPGLVARVNQQELSQARLLFHQMLAQLIAFTLPVALLISLASPFLLEQLHGASYREAGYLLALYVIVAALITPFGTAFGSLVTALGKPHLATQVVFVNSAINILLSFALMHAWGLPGAPVAMVLTEVFGIFWVTRILKKEANLALGDTWREVARIYINIFRQLRAVAENNLIKKWQWK